MDAYMILTLSELVVKYGIPATVALIRAWDVTDPTREDIERLRAMVPPPETYFAE